MLNPFNVKSSVCHPVAFPLWSSFYWPRRGTRSNTDPSSFSRSRGTSGSGRKKQGRIRCGPVAVRVYARSLPPTLAVMQRRRPIRTPPASGSRRKPAAVAFHACHIREGTGAVKRKKGLPQNELIEAAERGLKRGSRFQFPIYLLSDKTLKCGQRRDVKLLWSRAVTKRRTDNSRTKRADAPQRRPSGQWRRPSVMMPRLTPFHLPPPAMSR